MCLKNIFEFQQINNREKVIKFGTDKVHIKKNFNSLSDDYLGLNLAFISIFSFYSVLRSIEHNLALFTVRMIR